MMITDYLDPHVVSKPILQQIEQVTCIECCKYYIAPKTAPCGHSLCHGCWSGRRSCPTCGASMTRKSLTLNLRLQDLTDHVHILGEAFEKLFNVKLEDFTLNIPEMQSESDPTKHVKEWLTSSENHFSAPVSSQQSQDIVESVELSNSKIQIHEIQKKKETTKDNKISSKNAVPQKSQEDWDKIEILPDSEDICMKDKENIVGPMDIEPFYFEDNEYTTDHPRRSSRKRELKNDSTDKTCELSVEKQDSKNSGSDSKKIKQNWGNVKKMKKEFSKLNRNKSKLNVSIEMFKKSQNSANKPVTATFQASSPKPVYEIDDNTPNINVGNEVDSLFAVKTNEDKENNVGKPQKTPIKDSNSKSVSVGSSKKLVKMGINKNKINDSDQDQRNNLQNENNDFNETDFQNISIKKTASELVIKKSDLHQTSSQDNCIKITQKDVDPDSHNTSSPDDIEISIRIGSTVTNIVIKKKQNDVRLKIKTDQEIQTSLGPYGITNKRDVSCSPMQVDNIQNIEKRNNTQEIQIQLSKPNEKNNDKIDKTQVSKSISAKNAESAEITTDINMTQVIKSASTKKDTESADTTTKINTTQAIKSASTKKNMESADTTTKTNMTQAIKSASTKKNTESADTATANFEITESVEKELSDIMDCVETNEKDEGKTSSEIAKKQKSKMENKETEKETNDVHAEMELINDLDIFNSGSVKEVTVKSLQNAKAYSEILVPTNKSKKSQKITDKRDRETNDEEMPQNKKQKVDTTDKTDQGTLEEADKNVGNDSEHMNYDAIMSQVFANIDADIKSKTPSHQMNSDNKNEEIQYEEKSKATNILEDTKKDVQHQKYSENIFSIMDKDSEVIDVDMTNTTLKQVVEPDSTQKRIENLLTPGMCRDLVSSVRENTQDREVEPMDVQMGTPLVDHDDSDKSVVEETPQKNVSFTKLKQRTDSTNNKDKEVNKEKSTAENKTSNEKNNDSQIIKSIINISDTEDSGKLKDVTIVNMPRKTLETPLTINKFVGHIKHNSTPVARKSLNFDSENLDDPEQTLCPTTTQEKEFMAKAFEQTPKAKTPVKKPLGLKNIKAKETKKFCLAGSCLTATETANVKLLCFNNGWTYVDKYTKDITHLVVGVDDENKSQRSVKYMCALAASKWIVSYDWVEKCLITKEVLEERPYEALDACGEPGPMLSRIAPRMLFEGISFYCLSPFSILDVETLKYILEAAGGRVVTSVQGVRVAAGGGPALLLAEPEHTQEDRFIYLALELGIVPVNYEWVLNCLGTYSLGSLCDQLLCPMTILPPATRDWPAALMQRESQED